MDGMLLGRCREQNHFFFIDAFRRARERNLRDTDRQRARLVKHDGIRLGQRLDVVATLDEDAALRGRRNRRRNRCRRRELQAARKVDEQQVQHALPVARRAIDDGRTEERDRHEEVRHLVSEVLHGCLAALRFLDEVDDMREARVLADFLDRDDELARLDDGARIDGRILVLHGRVRLARDRRLVDGGRAREHAAVDDDLLARMRRNRVARAYLLDGNLALDAVLDTPDIALVEREQARNLRARTFGGVARQHLRAIRERQQRQARLGLSREHGRDDRRRRQRVGVECMLLQRPADAVCDELSCEEHRQEAARDLRRGEKLRRRLAQNLHGRKARERHERIAAVFGEAFGRRDGCFLCRLHDGDDLLLDFAGWQCARVPDAHLLFIDEHGLHHAIAAQHRREL